MDEQDLTHAAPDAGLEDYENILREMQHALVASQMYDFEVTDENAFEVINDEQPDFGGEAADFEMEVPLALLAFDVNEIIVAPPALLDADVELELDREPPAAITPQPEKISSEPPRDTKESNAAESNGNGQPRTIEPPPTKTNGLSSRHFQFDENAGFGADYFPEFGMEHLDDQSIVETNDFAELSPILYDADEIATEYGLPVDDDEFADNVAVTIETINEIHPPDQIQNQPVAENHTENHAENRVENHAENHAENQVEIHAENHFASHDLINGEITSDTADEFEMPLDLAFEADETAAPEFVEYLEPPFELTETFEADSIEAKPEIAPEPPKTAHPFFDLSADDEPATESLDAPQTLAEIALEHDEISPRRDEIAANFDDAAFDFEIEHEPFGEVQSNHHTAAAAEQPQFELIDDNQPLPSTPAAANFDFELENVESIAPPPIQLETAPVDSLENHLTIAATPPETVVQTTAAIDDATPTIAAKRQPLAAAPLEERYIVFKLDNANYAFPAINVAEVGQPLPVTALPFVPHWFLGVANLRGDILSVIGLRELWGKKTSAAGQRTKLIVIRSVKENLNVGLLVDQIREIRHYTKAEIARAAEQAEPHLSVYHAGKIDHDDQSLWLLDAEKLLETLRRDSD